MFSKRVCFNFYELMKNSKCEAWRSKFDIKIFSMTESHDTWIETKTLSFIIRKYDF